MTAGVVLVIGAAEAAHLHRAIVDHAARWGRVPPALMDLADTLAAIARHTTTHAATIVAGDTPGADHALMTYDEAARLLGVSRRTIGRHVAAGRLHKVGRRITRQSVDTLGGTR